MIFSSQLLLSVLAKARIISSTFRLTSSVCPSVYRCYANERENLFFVPSSLKSVLQNLLIKIISLSLAMDLGSPRLRCTWFLNIFATQGAYAFTVRWTSWIIFDNLSAWSMSPTLLRGARGRSLTKSICSVKVLSAEGGIKACGSVPFAARHVLQLATYRSTVSRSPFQ